MEGDAPSRRFNQCLAGFRLGIGLPGWAAAAGRGRRFGAFACAGRFRPPEIEMERRRCGSGKLFSEGMACCGTPALRFLAPRSIELPMARDSHSSASDIIPLLEGLTAADLDQVIAAAERQREARRESGKKELVEEFRAKAEALGLSLEDLVRG